MNRRLADYNSKEVQTVVQSICLGKEKAEDKLEAIFYYVRDTIKFGFLPGIDNYSASQIIVLGKGQCNNKSALFLALCKAAGIEARIHFSGIRKEIQRGLFKGIAYRFMPSEISHSWAEVKLGGEWKRFDAFINDLDFYNAGREELDRRGWKTGFSVSCESGSSSSEFSLDDDAFMQMDAITVDCGTYDDPSDFYISEHYKNRPNLIKRLIYRLSLKGINRRVESLRNLSVD